VHCHSEKERTQYNLLFANAFAAWLTGHQRLVVTADLDRLSRIPKLRLLKLPQAK
jgi:hypothetical protein